MLVLKDLGGCRVGADGVLAGADNTRLARDLERRLRESPVVVVDVSRLRLHADAAPTFLSTALIRAGGWPSARLVVADPDSRLRAALAKSGVSRDVVCADDVERAHARADVRPERVVRRIWLRGHRSWVKQAVTIVESAGAAWTLPDGIVDDARRIAGELVDDAVRRSRTGCVLQLSHDPAGLRVAVRDFGTPGRPRSATAWRSAPHADGTSVWAVVPVGQYCTAGRYAPCGVV